MVVHLAVAGDVFDAVLFCAVFFFFHEMSWMRSGTELSQLSGVLRIFLPPFALREGFLSADPRWEVV